MTTGDCERAEQDFQERIECRLEQVETFHSRGTYPMRWVRARNRFLRLIQFYGRWHRKQGYNEGYAAGIKDAVREFCCTETRKPFGQVVAEEYEI